MTGPAGSTPESIREKTLALIPALNAARTIEPVILAARNELQHVVVIDDGSSDDTAAVAGRAGATVLRHPRNRGKGGALKTGFQYVVENGFDAAITLDADGQHLPREIPKFLTARRDSGADLIIGGRAHLFEKMLPRRRFANRLSAAIISWAARTEITDSQSGFRYYSARLLREIRLRSEGFDLESEVIIRAGVRGFPVITIPIDLGFVDGLATSHYKPLADSLRIAWTGIRARFIWR
ncbi:MAG TPA: glycosyltransferase family 2 protein [Thermoanaerobaculia bacterium]|nr:glycosyltransferase family 2 protein [Thermoanaerobaculia bacterium]